MMSDSSKSKADETAVPPPTVFSSTPDLFVVLVLCDSQITV